MDSKIVWATAENMRAYGETGDVFAYSYGTGERVECDAHAEYEGCLVDANGEPMVLAMLTSEPLPIGSTVLPRKYSGASVGA